MINSLLAPDPARLMGVFSALAVERTDRGDALFLKMTRGACVQALDLDTFDFWKD
jgi:hypothetical protein